MPGSLVLGILQARRLDWVAMPSSRRSSLPRDQTHIPCVFYISCTGRRVLYHLCHLAGPLEKPPLAIIMFRGGGDWSSVFVETAQG